VAAGLILILVCFLFSIRREPSRAQTATIHLDNIE
jgi:hypothetical protein